MRTDNLFARKYHLRAILVLALVSTVPFINALSNGFVYDDISQIVENNRLRDLSSLSSFIQSPRGIKYIIHLAEYQIWGLNPLFYHLTNLILHILNTISIYLLLTIIFSSHRVPFITGLLFAVHPVHTEAVTFIASRNDLLAMFFFTWSFCFYIMKKMSLWFYPLSILFFLFAIMSKEVAALMLPIMLILYDLYFTEEDKWVILKRNSWYYAPYLFICVILFFIYLLIIYSSVGFVNMIHQYLPTFYTACKAFLIYLRLLFFPYNLNADHVLPLSQSLFEWNVLISLASLILFLILAVRTYSLSKATSFGMAWFFVTLFPVSNLLLPVTPFLTPFFVAERYLYLPSVGFCLIIATVIDKIMVVERISFLKQSYNKITIYLLTIILCLYSGMTISRNLDWRSEYSLWTKTVKQSPNSAKAHYNLGLAYYDKGLWDLAIAEYREALRINPYDADVLNNLGNAYGRIGQWDEAIIVYKKTLKVDTRSAITHYNLGIAFDRKGIRNQAINHYKKFLDFAPTNYGWAIKKSKNHINVLKMEE